ncbi:MAG: signal peptidase I [Longicatena sp.]
MMKEKKATDKIDILYNIVSTIRLFFICGVIVSLFFVFIARKETVRGTSMYPTLKDDQTVFINVAASYTTSIKRFDVVVAKNYDTDALWVKRVIGLPNETVEYKNDVLYIDGKEVKEPFLDKAYVESMKAQGERVNFTNDFVSEKLGEDEYLLVGDNRVNSLDSRNESVGAFKREQIIAKGVLVISPIQEMRYIGNGG